MNTTCEELNLTQCNIDDFIIEVMFYYLQRKTSLHTVILNDNMIGDKSMQTLSRAVNLGLF